MIYPPGPWRKDRAYIPIMFLIWYWGLLGLYYNAVRMVQEGVTSDNLAMIIFGYLAMISDCVLLSGAAIQARRFWYRAAH